MENMYKTVLKYCGDVDERIKACRSESVALQLKKQLCNELEEKCESEIINNFSRNLVDNLIKKYFDSSGRNKTIQE